MAAHALGPRDAQAELTPLGADVDDLSKTHVRFNQVKDGVAVLGGQVLTYLDANTVLEVTGNMFDSAGVDIRPAVNPAQAVKVARDALVGYNGELANKPDAALVVLPNQIVSPDVAAGSRLTYLVELLVEDGTSALAASSVLLTRRPARRCTRTTTWMAPLLLAVATACTVAR